MNLRLFVCLEHNRDASGFAPAYYVGYHVFIIDVVRSFCTHQSREGRERLKRQQAANGYLFVYSRRVCYLMLVI